MAEAIGLPAPWLLAGLLGGLAVAATRGGALDVPQAPTVVSQAVVGVALGASVAPGSLGGIAGAWPNATATLEPSVAATRARTSGHAPAMPPSEPGAIEAPSATPTTACETTVGACGTSSAPPRVTATASPPSRPASSHGAGRPTASAASPAAAQATAAADQGASARPESPLIRGGSTRWSANRRPWPAG